MPGGLNHEGRGGGREGHGEDAETPLPNADRRRDIP